MLVNEAQEQEHLADTNTFGADIGDIFEVRFMSRFFLPLNNKYSLTMTTNKFFDENLNTCIVGVVY